jgi:tetratricopeptide (TPR) repeat protein
VPEDELEMGESRRSHLAFAGGLAAAAFAVYAAGACPTIYVGDSGELVAAVHTLGIPHPSGYPLYVLAGKLWSALLPLGSVAFRMSLFSAFFAALAVGLLYLAARRLPAGRLPAAAAAILFAASPSFWGEANVQRVYALNAFVVAAATLLALRWIATESQKLRRRDRLFVLIAGICGLGAANHTFLAVWGLAFLAFALISDPALIRRWRTLGAAAGAALAGLLPFYGFLLLRSRQEPRLDWGNPETLPALAAVVTRRDFWPRRWVTGPGDLLVVARDFLASFAAELTLAGALLALLGLAVGLRRNPRGPALLLALVALANLAAVAAHGSRSDLFLWHRYFIPAYLCGALLAGIGLEALVRRARGLATGHFSGSRVIRAIPALLGAVAILGAILLVPLRWHDFDRSRYRIAEDYSRALLAGLPPGAHLAASDDNILFVLTYLQLVEGVRPDVDLILQGVGGELPPLRFDPDRDPLFFTHPPNWRHPARAVVPVGFVYRVVRAGAPLPDLLPGFAEKTRLDGEDDPRVPKDYLTSNLIGELHFMRGVSFEARDPDHALIELAEAARAAPDNDVLFYNLGLVYERMGLLERALAAFERSREINPREIPGPSRARAEDRIAAIRARLRR